MPYIGNPIYQSAFVVDQFSGNGATTAFTMSVAPAGVTNVLVAVSGVLQDPSTYGVVGNTITFSAAPPSGTGNISCRYLGVPVTGVVTTAYRTQTEFTATAGQTTFTPPSYTVGFIDVYRNGVLLGSADFTATNGTTVVLANPAAAGDLIETISFLVSSVLNAIPNTAGSVSSANIANDVTINFADGSASTPSITNNGDTNTGIFFPAADSIGFAEGGAEIARFDSSGNLGIGTTSPGNRLHVQSGSSGASSFDSRFRVIAESSGETYFTAYSNTFCGYRFHSASTQLGAMDYYVSDNALVINSSGSLRFGTSNTERMRIDSSGIVMVGTTSSTYVANGIRLNPVQDGGNINIGHPSGTPNGSVYMGFGLNGTAIGNIQQNGTTGVTYATSSDYRLKENIAPMAGALATVAALKPVTYKWKIDGSDGQGFIAHELQAVVPDAVTGEKDAVETYTDEDGNEQTRPKYQGIDTSFLVATLTAAIQELKTELDSVKAELATLKGAI